MVQKILFLLLIPGIALAQDSSFQADSLRRAAAEDAAAGESANAVSKLQYIIASDVGQQKDYVLLGKLLFTQGRDSEALDVLQALSILPESGEAGPFLEATRIENLAQETELIERLFERYIERLPDEEQEIYRDIGLVVTDAEREVYESLSEITREVLARRYWSFRDPTPLSSSNEHRLEHYRRVAHARERFSAAKFPWDDRGEVFVRLGAPDHLSRSNDMQAELDRDIQDARENFANRFRARPEVVPGHPTFPVRGDVKWEYWVYTRLAHGTEFTFVNEFGKNLYIFAPVPPGVPLSMIGELQRFHGRDLIEKTTAHEQVVYEGDADLLIDFYYYTAGFRGEQGKTRLEIYYGLPASEMARLQVDETSDLLVLDRGLALFNSSWEEVYRMKDQLAFQTPTEQQILDGAFIPGELAVELPPGFYHLALQVDDVLSGRSKAYREALTLQDFTKGDTLKISDLEVAFSITDAEEEAPFVKNRLKIIPMSSGSFRKNQHAFVYFEIYDLKRDEFGQARYRVSYSIRSLDKKSAPAKVLRGFGELFRSSAQGQEIEVAYDQVGNSSDDVIYVELDLSETEPGRQAVDATVTDLLTDQSASKSIVFRIAPYD